MVEFAPCFPIEKVDKIKKLIPEAQEKIKDLTSSELELPDTVECMSQEEIREGEKLGAGHGLYIPPKTIKINPHMNETGILLNYIHENIHFAIPNASENLVDLLTDVVAFEMKIKR